MKKGFLRFWHGYLLIEIKGYALERFINQMLALNINIWDLKRNNKNFYQAKILKSDFSRLRTLVRKRRCTVKIAAKKGIPFFFEKLKKRVFLLFGLVLFLAIFYFGSSYMWFVEIDGLNTIDRELVLEVLENRGITRGTKKSDVDRSQLENALLKELPRISWVNVKWQGTSLYIDLVEKKIIKKEKSGEIVAAHDGVIKEIIVLKGRAVVKVGDTVNKGQTLIVPDIGDEKARGIVLASVWYEGIGSAFVHKQEIIPTDTIKRYWGLKIGSQIFWLKKIEPQYLKYLRKREINTSLKWRNISFPIELIKEEHRKVSIINKKRTRDTALFLAKEAALKGIITRLKSDSIIEETFLNEIDTSDKNMVKVRGLVKVKEDIAVLNSNGES